MSTNIPSDHRPDAATGAVELQGLLRSALPRCIMSFIFEVTGFACFLSMFVLDLTAAWMAMALGALCMWQGQGLMRQVCEILGHIGKLHRAYPPLKSHGKSVTGFVHRYARLTGHAPRQ